GVLVLPWCTHRAYARALIESRHPHAVRLLGGRATAYVYPTRRSGAAAFAPAQRIFGHLAADGGGDGLARNRLRPRSVHCLCLRRRAADRRLCSRVHTA